MLDTIKLFAMFVVDYLTLEFDLEINCAYYQKKMEAFLDVLKVI